jgi:hypothetical protein
MKKIIAAVTLFGLLVGGCAGLGGVSEEPSSEAHKRQLVERATAFWKIMERQEWEKAYDYYDPLFRAAVSRSDYVRSRMSEIRYYNPRVAETSVRGRIADLRVAVEVEVTNLLVAPGRTHNMPRHDRLLEVRWLWMDGDWYCQFVGPQSSTFANY